MLDSDRLRLCFNDTTAVRSEHQSMTPTGSQYGNPNWRERAHSEIGCRSRVGGAIEDQTPSRLQLSNWQSAVVRNISVIWANPAFLPSRSAKAISSASRSGSN